MLTVAKEKTDSKIHYIQMPIEDFVFSVEHPVFAAYGSQGWYYDETGNILHFPVDNYFFEGERTANFLGEKVISQNAYNLFEWFDTGRL